MYPGGSLFILENYFYLCYILQKTKEYDNEL